MASVKVCSFSKYVDEVFVDKNPGGNGGDKHLPEVRIVGKSGRYMMCVG